MVSPVGNTVESTWRGIVNGVSGAAEITKFDTSAFTTRFSASVKDFSVEGDYPAKDARKMDPFIQFGMVAGIQAMRDSGLEVTEANATRIGVSIGSGIGGIGGIDNGALRTEHRGAPRVSPASGT